jgi:hypothetical protein
LAKGVGVAYLRIANLKKKYRISRTEYQEVLKGVNVEFKRGELVAVGLLISVVISVGSGLVGKIRRAWQRTRRRMDERVEKGRKMVTVSSTDGKRIGARPILFVYIFCEKII